MKRMLSLGALLVYIAGTGYPEMLHTLMHTPAVVVMHTAVEEKDPCHRTLYHGEANACDHDGHLVESDKCPLCDSACHVDQAVIVAGVIVSRMPYTQQHFDCYKLRLDSYWAVRSSSRAPPAHA